jgi:hypothetical protein
MTDPCGKFSLAPVALGGSADSPPPLGETAPLVAPLAEVWCVRRTAFKKAFGSIVVILDFSFRANQKKQRRKQTDLSRKNQKHLTNLKPISFSTKKNLNII